MRLSQERCIPPDALPRSAGKVSARKRHQFLIGPDRRLKYSTRSVLEEVDDRDSTFETGAPTSRRRRVDEIVLPLHTQGVRTAADADRTPARPPVAAASKAITGTARRGLPQKCGHFERLVDRPDSKE